MSISRATAFRPRNGLLSLEADAHGSRRPRSDGWLSPTSTANKGHGNGSGRGSVYFGYSGEPGSRPGYKQPVPELNLRSGGETYSTHHGRGARGALETGGTRRQGGLC